MSNDYFLTAKEQVNHCASKGIQFNDYSKSKATKYLEENNNYFKLRAFRKNYSKDTNHKYIHLDFADLVDLAIIDSRLRAILLEMAISIEHFSKVHLLKILQKSESIGTAIVDSYIQQLNSDSKNILLNDLKRNSTSLYCGDLYAKYINSTLIHCPVWVFIEIISFGQFLHFYEYCAKIKGDKELERRLYLMRVVKDLRNACAHNNCIINNIQTPLNRKPNSEIQRVLAQAGLSLVIRKKHLYRAAMYQIITTLYTHKEIVTSNGVHGHISESLQALKLRLFRDRSYAYNDILKSSFKLLSKLIDIWFPIAPNQLTSKSQ